MRNIKNRTTKKGFFVVTSLVLALTLLSIILMGMRSVDGTAVPMGMSGITSEDEVTIEIEKPKNWLTKDTSITIRVSPATHVKKVEARIGEKGSWVDITDDMVVDISENCTICIQVTVCTNVGMRDTTCRFMHLNIKKNYSGKQVADNHASC